MDFNDETPMNGEVHSSPEVGLGKKIVTPNIESSYEIPGMLRSPSSGRIKEPPVCDNPSLKKESMSTEELSKFCFPASGSPGYSDCTVTTTAMSTSSASSVSSRDSDHHQSHSALLNAKVIHQKTSRQGRETQRWVVDPNSQQRIRLVTGSVPILSDGRIVLVSASRKAEWILPKGGWELDETMEESAVRESFEEAGVLGTLGSRFTEIQYETRKSRKRRRQLEEMKKKKEDSDHACSSGASDMVPSEEDELQLSGKYSVIKSPSEESFTPSPPPPPVAMPESGNTETPKELQKVPQAATMSKDVVDRIRAARFCVSVNGDETSSVASDTSTTYSLVRMTLFPLYVCEIKDDWPENGRFRKAVDIDEALELMKSRPEFHAVLTEVKDKGIHLVPTGVHKETQ